MRMIDDVVSYYVAYSIYFYKFANIRYMLYLYSDICVDNYCFLKQPAMKCEVAKRDSHEHCKRCLKKIDVSRVHIGGFSEN